MAHYIDYNQTDGSTPVATLSRVGSVKPDGTSINISADGTISADSSYISTQSCPSNRYIDLTLLASGQTYQAPANGYFSLVGISVSTPSASNPVSAKFVLRNDTNSLDKTQNSVSMTYGGMSASISLRAKKGEYMYLQYNNLKITPNTYQHFRFYYDEGESNV